MHRWPTLLSCGLFATALVVSASCRSASERAHESSQQFRSLLQGAHTAVRGEGVRVARTPSEWDALWREHAAHVLPRPMPPEVDWSSEMVVCALLGERPSGGYAIEVEALDVRSTPWTIVARETRPPEGALVPMVVTQPFHMIAVAPRDGDPDLVIE